MHAFITLPNLITSVRILGTLFLLWLQPGTAVFFAVYLLCGISDVADGCIARGTGRTTTFGSRLDSAADLFFYAVMILRLSPILWVQLPRAIWWAAGGIVLVRLGAYAAAAVKFRRFSSMHTYANKLTGAAVFCIPFYGLLPGAPVWPYWAACAIAAFASVEELLLHLTARRYAPDRKSIFSPIRA